MSEKEQTYVEMLDMIVDGYYGDSWAYYQLRDLCKAADAAKSGIPAPRPVADPGVDYDENGWPDDYRDLREPMA